MSRRFATVVLVALLGCADDDRSSVEPIEDGSFRTPFGEECASPCLAGAVLGVTPREEAGTLVDADPISAGARRSEVSNETRFHHAAGVSVTLRFDDHDVLDRIRISVNDGSLTWNQALDTMGAPNAVRFALWGEMDGGYVSWFYDHVVLTSWLDEPQLARDHLVESAEITSSHAEWPFFPVSWNAISFTHFETPAWIGFRSVDEYLEHPSCRTALGSPGGAGGPCERVPVPAGVGPGP